jgi:hypothetical protein
MDTLLLVRHKKLSFEEEKKAQRTGVRLGSVIHNHQNYCDGVPLDWE